jgi:hypothetical protein
MKQTIKGLGYKVPPFVKTSVDKQGKGAFGDGLFQQVVKLNGQKLGLKGD